MTVLIKGLRSRKYVRCNLRESLLPNARLIESAVAEKEPRQCHNVAGTPRSSRDVQFCSVLSDISVSVSRDKAAEIFNLT